MGRKPSGRPAGRPPKPIDWNQFQQLCGLQCTQSEIASMFQLDEDTIRSRVEKEYGEDYSVIYKRFADNGKASLRRNQIVLSRKNASVAIWLGKIWLGQKDPALEDTKEDVKHALIQAVREIQAEPRIDAAQRSYLEAKQPLLDQKCRREETEVLP